MILYKNKASSFIWKPNKVLPNKQGQWNCSTLLLLLRKAFLQPLKPQFLPNQMSAASNYFLGLSILEFSWKLELWAPLQKGKHCSFGCKYTASMSNRQTAAYACKPHADLCQLGQVSFPPLFKRLARFRGSNRKQIIIVSRFSKEPFCVPRFFANSHHRGKLW